MDHKLRKLLAILLTGVGLLIYLLAWVLAYTSRSVSLPADWGSVYGLLISTSPLGLGMILGGLLIIKLPENLYGWVWLTLGLAASLQAAFQNYAIYSLMVNPSNLPFGWTAATIAGMCWLVMLSLVPLSLLLFPTGRPPTKGWYILLWMVLAGILVVLALGGRTYGTEGMVPIPNPNQISGNRAEWIDTLVEIFLIIIFLAIPAGVVSLLHRYRLADVTERMQLKWFAYGSVIFVITLGSDFLYTAPGVWEPLKEALFFAILPVTIGVAILRYRLWDIDVIIRKTLVYGILTVSLALLFFGAIVILQQLFGRISGTGNSPVAIVLSTLAIAALSNPLRRRVQDFIDRRFYRKKYNAEQALERFAAVARDETDIEQLSDELVSVVQETVQPVSLSLWLPKNNKSGYRNVR